MELDDGRHHQKSHKIKEVDSKTDLVDILAEYQCALSGDYL
jgi:hypothetical protein